VVLEGVIASTLRIFSFSLGLIIAKAFCSLGLKLGACGLFFLNVTPGLTLTVTIEPIDGTTPELIYSEPLIRDFPTSPEAELLLIFPRKIQPSAIVLVLFLGLVLDFD
jgi:ABC-type lipoprotein release transport system permease subunit